MRCRHAAREEGRSRAAARFRIEMGAPFDASRDARVVPRDDANHATIYFIPRETFARARDVRARARMWDSHSRARAASSDVVSSARAPNDIHRRGRRASTRARERRRRWDADMAFSERHRARWGGNVAIAGALLTFCAGTYWYTVQKVRKDEVDVAIERRAGGKGSG